jgi:hypothetical protein
MKPPNAVATDYPDRYVIAALKRVGVPEAWIDDALQDVRLYFFRWGCTGVQSVRSATIDAARKYGRRTRYGHLRLECVELDVAATHTVEADHSAIIVRDFMATLTPREQLYVVSKLRGDSMSVSVVHARAAVRRRWRDYVTGWPLADDRLKTARHGAEVALLVGSRSAT